MVGIGKKTETRGHITGFKEEIAKARSASEEDFFTWFDYAEGKDEAFVRGAWDFSVHVALPLAPYLDHPGAKRVLDIGYGAGRMLAAAARHFGEGVGVDIHGEADIVGRELKNRGVANVELKTTDGRSLPLEDASVDVAYSFIVFMHLEYIGVFDGYLAEVARVLKPQGLAVIYFGRRTAFSHNRSSRALYVLDHVLERIYMPKGYREFPARVNAENLYVGLPYAKRSARRHGLRVLAELPSHKGVPDGYGRYGRQHGLVLQRSGG